MTVKELKAILEKAPDDMNVVIRMHTWDCEYDIPSRLEDDIMHTNFEEEPAWLNSGEQVSNQVLILESSYPEEY